MIIEFSHHRDRAYARRLARATTTRVRITCAVTGLSAVGSGFAAFTADPGWAVLCGLAGLWVGATFLLAALILPWQAVRRVPAARYQTYTYRVDDEGIAWSASDFRSWANWAFFARVTERPFCYLLWQEGGGVAAWDIPRAPLTPEQDRRLAALLAERVRPAAAPAAVPAAGQAEPPAEPEPRSAHQVRPSAPGTP